jgi:hypothetical protein
MDFRAGPPGPDALPLDETVRCTYVETKLAGSSRKFDCAISKSDVAKVKYGASNGEVIGAVLSSRLLWALGFGADRVYPVRVTCQGCSSDPWTKRKAVQGTSTFYPAAIERNHEGHEIKNEQNPGWAWSELDLVDEAEGGASRAQRDALTLLAVFIQHTDSKPEQERLICLPGGVAADGVCEKPFMLLHDVGLTFGHGNFWNRTVTGSVNFDLWSKTPIWRDAAACVGHLSKSKTGTLGDPTISEAGRLFLSDLLLQLTDQQLHDLFEVARVDSRSRKPNTSEPAASVDEWVKAFKHKRDDIAANRCPA